MKVMSIADNETIMITKSRTLMKKMRRKEIKQSLSYCQIHFENNARNFS